MRLWLTLKSDVWGVSRQVIEYPDKNKLPNVMTLVH